MTDQNQAQLCPECRGLTVQFKGKGLDMQYRICTRYKEAGHLSEREISNAIQRIRDQVRPSGRYA